MSQYLLEVRSIDDIGWENKTIVRSKYQKFLQISSGSSQGHKPDIERLFVLDGRQQLTVEIAETFEHVSLD